MKVKDQELGRLWERYIAQECAALERREEAWISKNHEAPTVPGKKIKRGKSKPDFSGFTADGRHIVFEAKVISNDLFPKSRLAKHQLEHLQTAADHGALAFVYVLHAEKRTRHIIPIQRLEASYPLENWNAKKEGETFLDTLRSWNLYPVVPFVS
jgi:penicillin-binding protein-related factor A (putative recombinase)